MDLAMSVPFLLINEPSAAEEAKLDKLVIFLEPLPMATVYVFPTCSSWSLRHIQKYFDEAKVCCYFLVPQNEAADRA